MLELAFLVFILIKHPICTLGIIILLLFFILVIYAGVIKNPFLRFTQPWWEELFSWRTYAARLGQLLTKL